MMSEENSWPVTHARSPKSETLWEAEKKGVGGSGTIYACNFAQGHHTNDHTQHSNISVVSSVLSTPLHDTSQLQII